MPGDLADSYVARLDTSDDSFATIASTYTAADAEAGALKQYRGGFAIGAAVYLTPFNANYTGKLTVHAPPPPPGYVCSSSTGYAPLHSHSPGLAARAPRLQPSLLLDAHARYSAHPFARSYVKTQCAWVEL